MPEMSKTTSDSMLGPVDVKLKEWQLLAPKRRALEDKLVEEENPSRPPIITNLTFGKNLMALDRSLAFISGENVWRS